ncbi:group I truncated hemoglobin [Atopomonas sediminilitoris]|uniref:group I truncated hemoglobin n=1 Tax=Atopomonas sediminilitoris TaxID=2919919 RepID=UPI001F4E9EA4|nr:group 1 truncated hemoglobin [Atopomonas sediminilitoris]MCJ8169556.1 group 1 truncated hemoglobin [Atopomonas sediminilitoris]
MRAWLFSGLLVLLVGCATPAPDSLYQQLGGQTGITRIVEDMLLRAAADARIKQHFVEVDIVRVRDKLVEQLCELSGGPCTYSGDSMEESHTGLHISRSDFNALVELLQAAMDQQGVSVRAQNQLLAHLAPMRGEIIER